MYSNLFCSLSVGFVQSAYRDSISYDSIVQKLDMLDAKQADAALSVLFNCLKEIKAKGDTRPSLKAELIQGLLWRQLSQLRVDSAFYKADNVFKKIGLRFPNTIEGPWFRAMNQIEGGDAFTGIRILDSLSKTAISNRNFWSDYEKYAFLAFLPKRGAWCPAEAANVLSQECGVHLGDSGTGEFLKIYQWNVLSNMDGNAMPGFLYHLKFNYSKKWDVEQFSPNAMMTVTGGGGILPQFYTGNELNEILFNETEADLVLLIDLNAAGSSLQEFVNDKMQGTYDSISVQDEFADQQAYSIQCFQKNAHKNKYGGYAWYIAFDRYYSGKNAFDKEPDSKVPSHRVRYLIALNTCKSDRENAERNLKSLLGAFLIR